MKARSNYGGGAPRIWPLLNLAAIAISVTVGCGRQEPPGAAVSQEVRLSTNRVAPGDCVRLVSVVRNISPATVDIVSDPCDGIPRIDGALEQLLAACAAMPVRRVSLAPGAEHEEFGLAFVPRIDPGEYPVRVWHAFEPRIATDATVTVTAPTEYPIVCALAQSE